MSRSTPTLKAAVKFALDLQRKADQQIAADPYASPYRPTEASVRKLASRMAGEATRALPVDATPEQVAEAKASGPAKAILYMRLRAKQHQSAVDEQNEVAARSEARHKRRQAQARKERERQLEHLSPGQRVDLALSRLRVVASPGAARVGRDSVSSERDLAPVFCVDASAKGRALALRCARELEELVFEMTTRDLSEAA